MIFFLDETFTDVLVGDEKSTLKNQRYQSFIKNMNAIANELREHGIDSLDFVNPSNIGYKNGHLATFDLGFGNGFNQPPKLPVIDATNGKPLEIIKDKLNLSKLDYIGGSMFGQAYDIGNNKVLKITKDNSEVYNSLLIKGKKMKYVANIYDVYELILRKNGRKRWIIVLEKLKINQKIKSDFDMFKTAYEKAIKKSTPGKS